METYAGHRQIDPDMWTYDSVVSHGRIASIRDPLLITTESGQLYVPASHEYYQSYSGDRRSPLVPGTYDKKIIDYATAKNLVDIPELKKYLIWDQEGDSILLGMPLNENTQVFSATKILQELAQENNPKSNALRKLVDFFPDIDFGLLGSWAIRMPRKGSDFDLFIKGGTDFMRVDQTLKDVQVQDHLDIYPILDSKQDKYAEDYSKRFGVAHHRAKKIALLRNRYVLKLEDGTEVKFALSGAFSREDYKQQTLLGSKKIKRVHEEGVVTDTHNSVAFPREYKVNIDGQDVRVLSIQWVLQRMVEPGDKVDIRGNLRKNNNEEFISLEDYEDIIIEKE